MNSKFSLFIIPFLFLLHVLSVPLDVSFSVAGDRLVHHSAEKILPVFDFENNSGPLKVLKKSGNHFYFPGTTFQLPFRKFPKPTPQVTFHFQNHLGDLTPDARAPPFV